MFEPDNGKPINENKKTEVRFYTTMMRFTFRPFYMTTNLIKFKEITNRDVFGVSDHFSVSINGFNDGQQDFSFLSAQLMFKWIV
jgi:hypothetical protein